MYKISKRKFLISKFIFLSSWLTPSVAFPYKRLNLGKIIKSNNFEKNTSFMAIDLRSNKILDRFNEQLKLPIASVTKMVTAQYAINELGVDFRFKTDFFVDGVIKNGILSGDLYIKGYGDPTLTTDNLDMIANYFKENGINEVTGNLFYDDTHLPNLQYINKSQLPQYAYNPGISAINLNENRILFKWRRKENLNYDLILSAKGVSANGKVPNIRININNKKGNVYKYKINEKDYSEIWSVNKRILGRHGSRWLPVRNVAFYSVQVFKDLLSQRGVIVKEIGKRKVPSYLEPVKSHNSRKLSHILIHTLKHSKNMISEALGFKISKLRREQLYDLDQSGIQMTKWFRSYINSQNSLFLNHSGLTSGSFSTAADFRKFLIKEDVRKRLLPLLKLIPIYTGSGKKRSLGNITVKGKSGTMHYIRGMSGYVCLDEKPIIGFAIFSADLSARKNNLSNKFEKPKGASVWLSRAVIQERKIIRDLCKYIQSNQELS